MWFLFLFWLFHKLSHKWFCITSYNLNKINYRKNKYKDNKLGQAWQKAQPTQLHIIEPDLFFPKSWHVVAVGGVSVKGRAGDFEISIFKLIASRMRFKFPISVYKIDRIDRSKL